MKVKFYNIEFTNPENYPIPYIQSKIFDPIKSRSISNLDTLLRDTITSYYNTSSKVVSSISNVCDTEIDNLTDKVIMANTGDEVIEYNMIVVYSSVIRSGVTYYMIEKVLTSTKSTINPTEVIIETLNDLTGCNYNI